MSTRSRRGSCPLHARCHARCPVPAWTAPGRPQNGARLSSRLAFRKGTPRFALTRSRPPPASATREPRSLDLPNLRRVPTRATNRPIYPATNFQGPDPRCPPGDTGSLAQLDPARVGTCESRLGPSGCSQGASPKWPRRLGRSPGGGEFSPRGSVSSVAWRSHGAALGPRAGSAELAPGNGRLSLLPWGSRVQEAPAGSVGSFQGRNSIAMGKSHSLRVFARMKKIWKETRTPSARDRGASRAPSPPRAGKRPPPGGAGSVC